MFNPSGVSVVHYKAGHSVGRVLQHALPMVASAFRSHYFLLITHNFSFIGGRINTQIVKVYGYSCLVGSNSQIIRPGYGLLSIGLLGQYNLNINPYFRMAGLSPSHIIKRWVSTCFLNVLPWREICNYILIVSHLSQSDHSNLTVIVQQNLGFIVNRTFLKSSHFSMHFFSILAIVGLL